MVRFQSMKEVCNGFTETLLLESQPFSTYGFRLVAIQLMASQNPR